MTDANLAFSKLVANPTASAWAQAYDAGKLFSVLSLESPEPLETPESLNMLGKDILATLEQEFFTLENKDLDSIKRAIATATSKIESNLSSSFVVVYLVGNILYLFIHGKGKIVLKRDTKIGTLLESDDLGGELKSASGYLQDKDLVIIETAQFSKIISPQTLAMSLDHESPNEITEKLAPSLHEKESGAAAGLFIEYKPDQNFVAALEKEGIYPENEGEKEEKPQESAFPPLDFDEEETEEKGEKASEQTEEKKEEGGELEEEGEKMFEPISPVGFSTKRRLGVFQRIKPARLPIPHSRRMLISIGVIILLIFIGSVIFALVNRNSNANKQLFQSVYSEAKAKYDEGQGLKDLNESLAREDFLSAQKTINDNKDKFSKDSTEEKQILSLLSQVNTALSEISGEKQVEASEVNLDESTFLSMVSDNSGSNYFIQTSDSVFFIDSKGIEKVTKSTGDKSLLITKDWSDPAGLGTFGSNFYVLDKGDTIDKFIPTGTASKSAYVKQDYLSSSADLSNAVSMAIDGSIYVLGNDGTVEKYNKGTKQSFSLTGLDKTLNKPTKIWTDEDADNIYILDNGGSRIVAVDKDGNFKNSYSSSLLKNAKDFEVLEKDKIIYFLSGGKAYSISL